MDTQEVERLVKWIEEDIDGAMDLVPAVADFDESELCKAFDRAWENTRRLADELKRGPC